MARPKNSKGLGNQVPNSLAARSAGDKELRIKIKQGREQYAGDAMSIKTWARGGCTSLGGSVDDRREPKNFEKEGA